MGPICAGRETLSMRALRFQSLRSKLTAWFLLLSVIPLLVSGYLAFSQSRRTLTAHARDTFAAAASMAASQLDRLMSERVGDTALAAAWGRAAPAVVTQTANQLVLQKGYYDLVALADRAGAVLAVSTLDAQGRTVGTAPLVGRNVKAEPWFQRAVALPAGEVYAGDVAASPMVATLLGGDGVGLDLATPVYDDAGAVVAVWWNHVAWKRLGPDLLAAQRAALTSQGVKSAETSIVNQDGWIIEDGDASHILKTNALATSGAARALHEGRSGTIIEPHYVTGVPMIKGFAITHGYGKFAGLGWGVAVRQELDEGGAALRTALISTTAIVVVVVTLLALWIAGGLARPIRATAQVLDAVAAGDLTARVRIDSSDEIGRMGSALDGALDRLGQAFQTIADSAQVLAAAAEQLAAVSLDMGNNADQTSDRAQAAAAGAEQVSKSTQAVATGAEQMGAAIKEIARSATEATRISGDAVKAADSSNGSVAKLGDGSVRIGNVVKVITSIAEQTNLLALNATIEAARAGEGGKGFAVVAGEVKDLARETSRATDEVAHRIASIQGDTRTAMESIARIGGIIAQVSDLQTIIAAAVEQQSVTTDEITRSVTEAARASVDIAGAMTALVSVARGASDGAAQTRSAASDLARMASDLQGLVGRFQFQRGAPAA
jgi:methyl-accepting chemotaxis protein